MAPSSRDRISVDLHGLKAALFERAKALGVSPSGLVRETLVNALGTSQARMTQRASEPSVHAAGDRVRVCLRMHRDRVAATLAAARRAGLTPGDYVAGLVAGVPALTAGASRADHLAALIASSAEMSTLGRDIHHLTTLLRQGEVRAAQEYRQMLDTLGGDVRSHLTLPSRVLADLRPRIGENYATRPVGN
jgi:hypothetical protein